MLLLNGEPIDLNALWQVAAEDEEVRLSPEARTRMSESRQAVIDILETGQTVYGINTGFGKLSDVHIPLADLKQLQLNLVRSHSCGVGDPLSVPEVWAMMLLRANVLSLGYSGARPELAELLVEMLNRRSIPRVPERGSVGASGDLAPLGHLALAMIGEGEFILGRSVGTVELEAKEGLALLNGTQAMGAVGGLAVFRALQLLWTSNVAGTMSLEALKGTPSAFDERIQSCRPHAGQALVAGHLRDLLEGSEIRESHREGDPRVQDAYSLRCMPQVHGAVLDVLNHVKEILEIESASGTDNPLIFSTPQTQHPTPNTQHEVLSGGNFHGAPLAYAFDYAAIALADLANIVERRIDRLVNPDLNEGLPAFLAPHPGCSSGMMIAQVTAAALVNECRGLAHPASCDNTPTSGGKEDHVSMGMTAALKLRKIVDNLELLIAIELMCAAQGLEYRLPLKPGVGVQKAFEAVRRVVPHLEADRPLGADIEALALAVGKGQFAVHGR